MIFTERFKGNKKLLASSPTDIDFELYILSVGQNLLRNMLKFKYPTTLDKDRELL